MMKLSLTVLLFLISFFAFSQSGKPFDNYDPQLNTAEAQWLQEYAATSQFDFKNKTIGFIYITPGMLGTGKHYDYYSKKMLHSQGADKYLFKVIVLDSSEQAATNGYDALLLFSQKKHARKLSRSNKEDALLDARNRYPQIPEDAGMDNNSQLSPANAAFLNQLYAQDLDKYNFNFNDKKVLILEAGYFNATPKFISIKNYVQYVKNQLYRLPIFNPNQAYYLDEQQKQQSGGYDVIISILSSKTGSDLGQLLKFLEQNG